MQPTGAMEWSATQATDFAEPDRSSSLTMLSSEELARRRNPCRRCMPLSLTYVLIGTLFGRNIVAMELNEARRTHHIIFPYWSPVRPFSTEDIKLAQYRLA